MHNNLPSNHTFSNPLFIGTVVNNNDPTHSYRVKVRVPELHPSSLVDADLPWAAKVDSSFMGWSTDSELLHSVPQVGTKVLILSVANDPNSLLYLGSLYTNSSSTPSGDDYFNCYGIYDKNGNFIQINKIKQVLELMWEGKLDVTIKGNIEINTDGNMDITVKGNANIKSEGMVSLESAPEAMISIKGGIVQIERATQMGFNCLQKCILTGAPHVSNVTM